MNDFDEDGDGFDDFERVAAGQTLDEEFEASDRRLPLVNRTGRCQTGWSGDLTYTFTYDPVATAVPLPAAAPLFATGLGALGLLGWRRKKKTATLAA